MQRLPLNLQILAAPVVLALPIIVVIFYTLLYLDDISAQNDTVREWARATDHLKIAKSTAYQMGNLLTDISLYPIEENSEQKEELFFNYIEQSQVLKSNLNSSDITDKVSSDDLALFASAIQQTHYSEDMSIQGAIVALQQLSPKLDYIYNVLQAKKRSLYIQSNTDITEIISKLSRLILTILGIATFLAIIIAALVSTNLQKRLKNLSQMVSRILHDDEKTTSTSFSNTTNTDKLEQIENKLNKLSKRLNNSIESEKILQATEDERQRIALDIHDQFLAEITQLRRELNYSRTDTTSIDANPKAKLAKIDTTLEKLNVDLRSLINDLFPHSLDMLGLEASVNDYIRKKIPQQHDIDYYVHIDETINANLNQQQCLHLYRIIIEAVNNILKHAHCNRFEIVFKKVNERIILTIEDNGCGFSFNQSLLQGHMGLLSIKQRASILDADASWHSSRFSSGTCLKISLDLSKISTTDTLQSAESKKTVYA